MESECAVWLSFLALSTDARRNGWPIVIFSQRTKSVIRRTLSGVATAGIGIGGFVIGTQVGRNQRSSSIFRR